MQVLEHVSTKAGVEAVKQCGPNVRGTITAHHLWGTVEDAQRDVFNQCKPVMKTADDRLALIRAAFDGSSKFFFGSDSAPHPIQSKTGKEGAAAGCFTQPYVISLAPIYRSPSFTYSLPSHLEDTSNYYKIYPSFLSI